MIFGTVTEKFKCSREDWGTYPPPQCRWPFTDFLPEGAAIRGQCSFSADTTVATEKGEKAISALAVGEKVLAYDEKTGETGNYLITAVLKHDDPMIVHLTLDGEHIETTPEHPFYTQERGWVAAGELKVGEHIRKADNSYGIVRAVQIVKHQQTMYNLTVDQAHTFFVGQGQWLVHNKCVLPPRESGMPKKVAEAISGELEPGQYLGVTDVDMGTFWKFVKRRGWDVPFKPEGAETILKGPRGLRLVLDSSGEIRIVLNDLDAAFMTVDGELVSNTTFVERYLRDFNDAIGFRQPTFQHGPKLNGFLLEMKGTGLSTLRETVYMFGSEGFIEAGPMWKMARKYTGLHLRDMVP